jgi:hypothetical protein
VTAVHDILRGLDAAESDSLVVPCVVLPAWDLLAGERASVLIVTSRPPHADEWTSTAAGLASSAGPH